MAECQINFVRRLESESQKMDPKDFFRGFFGMPPRQPGVNISINYIKDSSPDLHNCKFFLKFINYHMGFNFRRQNYTNA